MKGTIQSWIGQILYKVAKFSLSQHVGKIKERGNEKGKISWHSERLDRFIKVWVFVDPNPHLAKSLKYHNILPFSLFSFFPLILQRQGKDK